VDENFLNLVSRPGRYIGREVNAVRKNWSACPVRMALCFPETYELGMSNLGIRILYDIVNSHNRCLAERVFAPDLDMETILRREGRLLATLESDRPLCEFDLIGVNLAAELSYINLITILELGGIPVLAAERKERDPIILAGGNGAFTPEPMADFIDAFFIGEAEDMILKILETLEALRGFSRADKLAGLSELPGIYIPAFYRPAYDRTGVYQGLHPQKEGLPSGIRKVSAADFADAPFPEKWLVPYLSVVHDRIGVEIMRGCVHRCKFCQARVIYGPCRVRPPEKIRRIVEQAVKNSGYEEISLLSLSTGDYPRLAFLVEQLTDFCRSGNVRISFPSLRADTLSLETARGRAGLKQAALTFAPETSERLRLELDKPIRDRDLFEQAETARKSGWRRMKLYFMLGLPGETDQDLAEIVRLVRELSRILQLNVSFNTFIPKPHTPLERYGMAEKNVIAEKKEFLQKGLRSNRYLAVNFHPYEQSFLEAVICRADRRLAPAILGAWKMGARFAGWPEHFHFSVWESALAEHEIDPGHFLGPKTAEAVLPWSHIMV